VLSKGGIRPKVGFMCKAQSGFFANRDKKKVDWLPSGTFSENYSSYL
jgi:hypothetical protein